MECPFSARYAARAQGGSGAILPPTIKPEANPTVLIDIRLYELIPKHRDYMLPHTFL
jgi:hypothetical protein